jgi:hypothetical protein
LVGAIFEGEAVGEFLGGGMGGERRYDERQHSDQDGIRVCDSGRHEYSDFVLPVILSISSSRLSSILRNDFFH